MRFRSRTLAAIRRALERTGRLRFLVWPSSGSLGLLVELSLSWKEAFGLPSSSPWSSTPSSSSSSENSDSATLLQLIVSIKWTLDDSELKCIVVVVKICTACCVCRLLPLLDPLLECSSACFVGLSVFAAVPTAQVFSSSDSSGALWLLVPHQDRLACFLKLLKSHGTVTCEEWCTLSPSPGLWVPSRQMALSPPPPTLTLPHISYRISQKSFNTSRQHKT